MTDQPTLRDRAIDAAKQTINALGMWLPPAGREAVVDAVAAVHEAELHTARQRAVTFQHRLDDARIWARTNLPADQQYDLLAILGGREGRTTPAIPATLEPPKETPDA
ncbi:hypothetical protein ACIQV3_22535 [Streptomyces sp. NPDC099050]|uniref:hypothetical protein n=1 Tax=Streptomyces sp. NPDC099050 TaxID=3366100 RepID=UPI0038303836